jgi:hypothetical protein
MRCGTVCALKTPVIKCCHGPRIHPIRGRIAPSLFALTLFVLTLGAARATEPPSQPAIQPPGADSLEAVVFKQTDDTLGGMVRAGRTSFAAALLVQQGRP